MVRSPGPIHVIGVREVQAKTRELQNKSEGDGRLAHTAENQQISHEKAEHYKSKHAPPPRLSSANSTQQ
jgi:hypothetical protein